MTELDGVLSRTLCRSSDEPRDSLTLLAEIERLEGQAANHRLLIARAVTLLMGEPEDREAVQREFDAALKEYLREDL